MVYQWKELLNNYKISNGGDTKIMMIESYSTVDVNMRYYGAVTKEGAQIPVIVEFRGHININPQYVFINFSSILN